jgi:hypothetical protein
MPESAEGADGVRCLNCGEPLHGPFCSRCGQRAVPAYPSLRELVGDAWHELSGYDGRVVRTFRQLLRHPGALTIEVMEGHRARYVSPVRIYLVASLLYFLVSAASPDLGDLNARAVETQDASAGTALGDAERAHWLWRPVARAAARDPDGFADRLTRNLPRTFFVLVPVFAGIAAIFFRRRPFTQHLVFALHLHAVVFLAQALRDGADFTYSTTAVTIVRRTVLLFIAIYALAAFKRVYGEPWGKTALKVASIGMVYGAAAVVALFATLLVAAGSS